MNAYLGPAAGNGQKAAELAGYAKGSARITASRLLSKSRVQAAVANKRQQLDIESDIQIGHLLTELQMVAFSDVRRLFDEQGNLRPIAELEDGPARAVATVELARETTRREGDTSIKECVIRVRQWDKLKALELIGKLRGFFTEKHEHQVMTPRPVIHVHERVEG